MKNKKQVTISLMLLISMCLLLTACNHAIMPIAKDSKYFLHSGRVMEGESVISDDEKSIHYDYKFKNGGKTNQYTAMIFIDDYPQPSTLNGETKYTHEIHIEEFAEEEFHFTVDIDKLRYKDIPESLRKLGVTYEDEHAFTCHFEVLPSNPPRDVDESVLDRKWVHTSEHHFDYPNDKCDNDFGYNNFSTIESKPLDIDTKIKYKIHDEPKSLIQSELFDGEKNTVSIDDLQNDYEIALFDKKSCEYVLFLFVNGELAPLNGKDCFKMNLTPEEYATLTVNLSETLEVGDQFYLLFNPIDFHSKTHEDYPPAGMRTKIMHVVE